MKKKPDLERAVGDEDMYVWVNFFFFFFFFFFDLIISKNFPAKKISPDLDSLTKDL